MTSMSRWTSEFQGGLRFEHKTGPLTSHDEKKASKEGDRCEAPITGTNKGEEAGCETASFEIRQGRQSVQSTSASKAEEKSGGSVVNTDAAPNLPKTGGQIARVLGNLTNDPRVTNVLLVLIALIGMGGAEAVQSQICSL